MRDLYPAGIVVRQLNVPTVMLTLKLHTNRKLVCHYCGHTEMMPGLCPGCGSKNIGGFGIGTQQIELAVRQSVFFFSKKKKKKKENVPHSKSS